MAIKNPFKVLGIEPNILRGLSDEQIAVIIKSQYRTLQTIFHPDITGNGKRSAEINEAFDLLDSQKNPELYAHYKEDILKKTPAKKRISQLEAEIINSQQKKYAQHIQLVNYFRNLASFTDDLTVFNAAPCRLKMLDYQKSINLSTFAADVEARAGTLGTFYHLIIEEDGTIIKETKKRSEKINGKYPIGTISEDVLKKHRSMNYILKKAMGIWTPDAERFRHKLATNEGRVVHGKDTKEHSGRIDVVSFQEIMPLITPYLAQDSYIFSINQDPDRKETYFTLEGMILKIER